MSYSVEQYIFSIGGFYSVQFGKYSSVILTEVLSHSVSTGVVCVIK